jgi:hypothetical protein
MDDVNVRANWKLQRKDDNHADHVTAELFDLGFTLDPPPHGRGSERTAMTDPAAEALAKEQLFTVLARLMAKINLLDRELRNFDRLRREMKDLVDHPPPHTDADALRQDMIERIKCACEILDKMHELLPPELRIE